MNSASRARQQHVVRRDAGLSGVDQLAEHDALHCVFEARARADDRRRFAAQLQRHRSQVGRRRAHHVMADRGGAGEQQVVERQRGERLRHRGVTVHHDHLIGREVPRHLLGEQRREARSELAHLQHRAIAGHQRVDQRTDGQVQRVVPRHDDADHAARLRPQLGARGQEQQTGEAPPRLHPAPAVAERVTDRRQAGKDFQQVGFLGRALAEVGADRRGECRALFEQHGFQRTQAPRAGGPIGHRLVRLRGAQTLQHAGKIGVRGIGHGVSLRSRPSSE